MGTSTLIKEQTINKAINCVLSIKFAQVQSFDTEPATNTQGFKGLKLATGFIVDKRIGLILTNRHVCCSGPFVGDAIFNNHEQVPVYPIYRDPVHDFGFLKFDPSLIKYMALDEIELDSNIKIGAEIKVLGNDAGEKLSILSGSISRIDRNAPDYGELSYNDFNTFYLQAASSTSGGSSGSPVLNIEGCAVALQAGGATKAATDFFFPLERVERSLKLISRGKPVPRGTIQTVFLYQPFDQVKKLGLSSQTEEIIRKLDPFEIGMLQVETVLPKGPASGHLLEGDILISINNKIITKFVPLEEIIDNNVNQTLDFEIERACIKHIFKIKVQDLFEITPDRYVEISGAVVNNLSYQLARQYCVPVQGVYVCHPNGIFRFDGTTDSGWIIQSVNSIPTPTIDEFIKVFEKIPDKSRFPVTYYSIADQHSPQLKIVQVDYEWHEFRLAKRIDSQPKWEFKKLVKTPAIKSDSIVSATFPEYDESLGDSRIVLRSLVKVSMTMPMLIDGYPKHRKEGSGLVIDSKRGLVLVSRQIVPFSLGRVNLTFADSIVVEAKIIFLHPTQNVAVLSYDVNSIGTTPVLAASISDIKLSPGSKVKLVALNQVHRPVCIDTTVTDISPVTIPWNNVPRFRAINFQGITLETPLSQQCSSGVLTDNNGSVQGLWLSFLGETTYNGSHNQYHFGIHINPLLNTIKQVINENKMLVGLAAEFTPLRLAACRELGLTQKWTEQVEKANQYNRTLFLVQRTESGTLTSKVLQDLDLIIKIDGDIITRLEDLELHPNTRKHLKVTLYRAKKEMTLNVPTSVLDGDNATMYILWCGALIQSPHRAVLQQSKSIPSMIYISDRESGSPAYRYNLQKTEWITEVNGVKVFTLQDFWDQIKNFGDGIFVRVRTVSFDGAPLMLYIKMETHYFPTKKASSLLIRLLELEMNGNLLINKCARR